MYRENVLSVNGAFSLSITRNRENLLDISGALTDLTQNLSARVLAKNSNYGGEYGRRA
jgi:hypothetical protein